MIAIGHILDGSADALLVSLSIVAQIPERKKKKRKKERFHIFLENILLRLYFPGSTRGSQSPESKEEARQITSQKRKIS